MDARTLIIWCVVGVVAGFLASLVIGGAGLIRFLVTGLIGSFVGGFLAQQFNIKLGIGNPLVEQICVATAGAIIVVVLARMIA